MNANTRSGQLHRAGRESKHHRRPWQEHVADLQQACSELGICRGRARDLTRLLTELFEEGKRSRNHILAPNESFEITDIYRFWHPHLSNFPRLKQDIAKYLGSGPVVAEEERTGGASNRARNQAFVYLMAGYLINAGVDVIATDGIPRIAVSEPGRSDIIIEWKQERIVIECKRPQSLRSIQSCLREAVRQITDSQLPGIVALDCSRIVRPMCPGGKLLEKRCPECAESCVQERLGYVLSAIRRPSSRRGVLGMVLFARVAAMIVNCSRILSPGGEPYEWTRPYSVCSTTIWRNADIPATRVVQDIWEQVDAAK